MSQSWNPDFAVQSPVFAPLLAAARELGGTAWPGCADFNRLLAARGAPVVTAGGQQLRFVEQTTRPVTFADRYEPRIFLRGEVQFRPGAWHDVFNALVWLTFPRVKAALNARHYRALLHQHAAGTRDRGPAQDALTLFDESGVIVVTCDVTLAELLARHAWKVIFWHSRAEVTANMRFHVMGHGLYVKMLQPFVGVTGRGIVCEVPAALLALPLCSQLPEIDSLLAAQIGDSGRVSATRELMPVPLLGIPGWCPENEAATYYDNTRYFRPKPCRR